MKINKSIFFFFKDTSDRRYRTGMDDINRFTIGFNI